LEPPLRTDATLKTEFVRVGPSAEFEDELDRFFDLFGVRIALLDECYWQAVGTENEMDFVRVWELHK
jgi:hypothetical protein